MHASGGLAAAGAFFTVFGLLCMYLWKCTPHVAAWLMGIGGACFAAASWGPLTTATGWGVRGASTAGGWIGIGAGVTLIVGIALVVHAVRAMHPKKGPRAGKSEAWAAFFAPAIIGALGGFIAVAGQIGGLMHQVGNGLSAFIGGH